MSNLSEKYSQIISDIEKRLTKPEDKTYVIKKIEELSSIYMELIDRVTRIDDERIEKLEEKQEKIVGTLSKIQETVNLIKKDIYEDDGYDFEIVCPYCNHEFVADVESELKEEIECPECHNVIELDWDDEEGCDSCNSHHCGSCGFSNNANSDEEEYDNEENNEIDDDDDM